MPTVLSILGTRPEAIKMAPVIHALAQQSGIRSIVCSTGQHREMLDQVFCLFDIRPDHELSVMRPNQSLAGVTARLCDAIDEVVQQTQPDWILAQGDTTTVLVAALVAFYRRLKFGHVEAGLRTGDLAQPFPEELNRRIADEVSTLLFAPTEHSRDVLLKEGKSAGRILVTGNTVIDALRYVAGRPYDWNQGPLADVPRDKRLVLVTTHRRENLGGPLEQICSAIRRLSEEWGPRGVEFVFPVHLNPNVRQVVFPILGRSSHVHLLEPLDYHALVQVMQHSTLILTDSGGIQEEAPGLKVPVLVLRETTERPEGVTAGVVQLVGTDEEAIFRQADNLLRDELARQEMILNVNPYGDGRAAERIVAALG